MRGAKPGPRGDPRRALSGSAAAEPTRSLQTALKNWLNEQGRHSAARARARRAPVRPGERVLAVALGDRDELAVATDWALYHEAAGSWARVGWDEVGEVKWDSRVLALTGLAPGAPAAAVLRLARAFDLPEVATERVAWTCVIDQRLSLNGSGGARVLARRVPGQADLRWVVVVDNGIDPGDPAFKAALESALRGLRAVTGV